ATAAPSGRDDGSGRDRDDRRANRGAIIDAQMGSIRTVNGVQTASREPGGDARLEPQRRSQEEPLQRATVLVIERRLARCRVRPSERAQIASVGEKPRSQNRTVARKLPIVVGLFDQDVKAVAGLKIA